MPTPIRHVVIIVKENHTFDNYFGRYPGANGAKLAQATNPPPDDPDHRHQAWMNRRSDTRHRVQYTEHDIPSYYAYARQFTLCDNYFSEVAGPSTPNHLMLIAADSPFINNPKGHYRPQASKAFEIPSLPQRLEENKLTWGNYGGYAFKYIAHLARSAHNHKSDQFAADAAKGNLPTVSWLYAPEGLSEHPPDHQANNPGNVTDGSNWTKKQIDAIVRGKLWANAVVFITWDDWGGWYDHVTPPVLETWKSSKNPNPADAFPEYDGQPFRLGSRVPCLVISPFAKRGYISHVRHSHVSLVKFCETAFGIEPLNERDKSADDMSDCFDFGGAKPQPIPSLHSPSKPRRKMHVVVRPNSVSEKKHAAGILALNEQRAPGLPASPDHDLVFQGGKTIPALSYVNVYVGGDAWSPTDLTDIDNALLSAMTDSDLNNVVQQYFGVPISTAFHGRVVLKGGAPAEVTRGDIASLLQQASASLGDIDPATTVVNFMLPPATVLTTGPDPSGNQPHRPKAMAIVDKDEDSSLNGLGGYHGSQLVNGTSYYFAVGVYSQKVDGQVNGIPAFDEPWKNVVATFYHELQEARTDPDVEEANATGNESVCGWISAAGEEIGDFPVFESERDLSLVFQEVPLTDGTASVPVQFLYSNAVHGPEGPVDSPEPPAA
jgi:phospholipase C